MPGRSQIRLLILLSLLLVPGLLFAAEEGPASDILLSRQLAGVEDLSVGDTVELGSEAQGGPTRRFRVAGIYEPTPDPFRLTHKRHEVRMHLGDLIDLVAEPGDPQAAEAVDRVNITINDPSSSDRYATALNSRFPAILAGATAHAPESRIFVVLEQFHFAVAMVTVLGSAAFLLALMVMRADQRRETAGILRLIGVSRPRILLEIFIEGALIALAGALFGVLLAKALEGLFNAFFQWHYDTALIFVRVTPGIALRCVVLAVPLGVLAGLVASWTLLRRQILELLHR